MKKLITLFLVATVLSCNSEDQAIQTVNADTSSALSVLDGEMLSYKDDKSFVEEYSALTKLKSGDELRNWISKKGHPSLLEVTNESLLDLDDVGETHEVSKIIYSDALSAVLNNDSKVKINGKILWLNEQNFYVLDEANFDKASEQLKVLKSDLKVYGNVFGEEKSNATGRTIANANKAIGWEYGYRWGGRERKLTLVLFNETIYLNGDVKSTKMFLKAERLGRYCSTWKCRWNSDSGGTVFVKFTGAANWQVNPVITGSYQVGLGYELNDNANTVLFADGAFPGPVLGYDSYFSVGGPLTATVFNDPVISFEPANTTWTQQLSWY